MRRFKLPTSLPAIALMLALASPLSAQFTPASGSPFTVGSPSGMAVADFNEDGFPDLAVTNFTTGTVTILFGNGTGSFAPTVNSSTKAVNTVPVGNEPSAIVTFPCTTAASSSGSASAPPTHMCLAVANQADSTISILIGDGKGNFPSSSTTTITVGMNPVSLAVWVSPGAAAGAPKGTTYLATANFTDGSVTMLSAGNNGAAFSQVTNSPFMVGKSPSSIVLADFNGDGWPDFAVTNKLGVVTSNGQTVNQGNVAVWVSSSVAGSNGMLSTAPGSPYNVLPTNLISSFPPAYPVSITAADVNQDGSLDLIIVNEGTNSVWLLKGNGKGVFAPFPGQTPISVGSTPMFVAAGLLNADQYPDLAVVDEADNNVMVLFGNGTSGFVQSAFNPFTPAANSPFPVGKGAVFAVLYDFNGDGKPDIAVANQQDGSITVLLNEGYAPVIVSAASYAQSPVALGAIVSIFGSGAGFPSAATTASTVPLPMALGNTTVIMTFSDGSQSLLPLFYASPSQINAMVPTSTPLNIPINLVTSASITIVSSSSGLSQTGNVNLLPAAPSLFSANSTGQGVAAAQFLSVPSLTLSNVFLCGSGAGTCGAVPLLVTQGSQLILYGTGIRNAPQANVTVTVGGMPQVVTYAGAAPNNVGEDQVNVTLSPNLPIGLLPVVVSVGSQTSNAVTILVQ